MPAVTVGVLALLCGLIAAWRLPLSLTTALILLALLALAATIRPHGGPERLLLLGVLGMMAAGFTLGHAAASRSAGHCLAQLRDGQRLVVRGFPEALAADGRIPIRIREIRVHGRGYGCKGTVRVRLPAGESVAIGGGVTVTGRWWLNPSDGNWPTRPERSGLLAAESVAGFAAIHPGPLLSARIRAQERLRRLYPERAGVAEALLLARREGLDPGLRDRLARAGLTHLLAISGLHVGLIAGALLLLGSLARLPARTAAIIAAAATSAYVLFLGAPHAAARAALQVLLVLTARVAQRPANAFALLGAAAIPLLAIDPLAALEPGFQLSFAGTAGILALRRRFLLVVHWRALRAVTDSVATGIAATLATAPIAALHFGLVAPVGILANLLALPLVALAVPATALALLASLVSWQLASFLAGAGDLLLAGLDAVTGVAAEAPGGHAYVSRDGVHAWVAATVLAALAAGRLPLLRRRLRRLALAGIAAAVLLVWGPATQRFAGGSLEIHAVDVGQGDAFAIRTPAGRWLLVDAGPASPTFDAGRSRVVPYLLRAGARRVEAIILTHPHLDHIGGAGAVLEMLHVGAVLDPALPAPSGHYIALIRTMREKGGSWYAARAGREFELDGVRFSFLFPDSTVLDVGDDANEVSVVLRLEYGAFAALFLGDSPSAVEELLVGRYGPALRADLLKVGHHGSATSTSEALLSAARPELALVSLGRRNRYGHPAPLVLDRLERHGVRLWRTDADGAITVRVSPDGRTSVETVR